MTEGEVISWLLKGDVSIQYQTHKYLLGKVNYSLQRMISKKGWGKNLLALQREDGHWGQKYYQPKWTSSHYTLLDLRYLEIDPDNKDIRRILNLIFEQEKGPDGGIRPIGPDKKSDVCLNGMVLNFSSYFRVDESKLKSIVDFILSQKMPDGGFNCLSNRKGAVHSSLHSTCSIAEGILQYRGQGYSYRISELLAAEKTCQEFILKHRLFLSDRTGQIIRKDFLQLSYPWRWKFNILKGLVYFCDAGVAYDERMAPAIDVLIKKRRKDNRWNLQSHHPGALHFEMEKAGFPSRWNTMMALRILKQYQCQT